MKKESIQDLILELQKNIADAPNEGFTILLVDANPQKGYNYEYVLAYPNENMGNILVMNCLNDYEVEIGENETENINAIEQIYNLFGENRVVSKSKVDISDKVQEDEEKSLERVVKRLRSATDHITIPIEKFHSAPVMMPLVPGYYNEGHENVASELQSGVAKELAPQIVAMIEDACSIVKERTGKDLNEKIIDYGHSKEAQFAEHFSILYPEKVKALIFGGGQQFALPVKEIRLVIDDNRNETEQFTIKEGIPYKRVTKSEYEEIKEEYDRDKKPTQSDIKQNGDMSYSLPLNYPLGIADIEQYLPELLDEKSKEEYIKTFIKVPRILFNGENEEKENGHFTYSSGKVPNSNDEYKYGTDVKLFEIQDESSLYEVECASMHNRVLDYVSAERILFGKSGNERLRNYMDIATKLGMNIQSKIYKYFGHKDINSNKNEALINDLNLVYSSLNTGNEVPALDNNGRADRISPVFQLLRRYMVSKTQEEFDNKSKKWKEFLGKNKCDTMFEECERTVGTLGKEIYLYISKTHNISEIEANIDRVYDSLTTEELEGVFERVFSFDKNILVKNALSTEKENIVGNEIISNIDDKERNREERTEDKGEFKNE